MKNAFEELDLDPLASTFAITERVRDLSEDASEPRQKELRALWEDITRHPRARITAAVATFVAGEEESPVPPPRAPLPEGAAPGPSFLDKLPVAGLAATLGAPVRRPPAVLSVHDDPILQEALR